MRFAHTTAVAAVMFALAASALAEEKAAKKEMSPTEQAVRKVVQQHFDGIANADIKQLEEVWDTGVGQMTFVGQGKGGEEIASVTPIREAFKSWTAKKHKGTKGHIESVDMVHGKMALVKAQIVWNRQIFEDYLTLLNTDGEWKLVHKTYTTQKPSFYGGVSAYGG